MATPAPLTTPDTELFPKLWSKVRAKSWYWLFDKRVLALGLSRHENVSPKLCQRTGEAELEIFCQVAESSWDRPVETRVTLRINDKDQLSVLADCPCREAPYCRHTAAVLAFACAPDNQQALEWFAASKGASSNETAPIGEPTPGLRLRPANAPSVSGPSAAERIGVAEPLMHYPGCEEPVSLLRRQKTHTWTDGSGTEHTFVRNALVERLMLADLMESGLMPFANAFPVLPPDDPAIAATLTVPLESQSLFWSQFVAEEAPKLRKAGWQIDVAPDFGFSILDAPIDRWYSQIDETTDRSDLYDFDLGIEHDGKRISLIPILANAIEQGLSVAALADMGPDGKILLSIDEGNAPVVSVPARHLLPLLRFLDELLDAKRLRKNPGGKLRLDRLRAAQLDGLEGLPIQPPENLRRLRERLRNFEALTPVPPPAGLQATLRDYQAQGLTWLQFLREFGLNGVLADDMGLGKTLQTLAHLQCEHDAGRTDLPSLILAPTSVLRNWVNEARRFTPQLSVLLLHGSSRQSDFQHIASSQIVVTSYPLLVRDLDRLQSQSWHCLILDEAQNIKNPRAQATQAACSLTARHRLCLSGTPMENHLGELWSLFHFLMPGFLGDKDHFRRTFRNPIEKDADTDQQNHLAQRIRPVLLRRTKDAVAQDLPPKTEILHYIDLPEAQTQIYETIRAAMDKRVRDAIAQQGLDRSHIIVLDALLKLRQVCCHPALLKKESTQKEAPSAKTRFLLDSLLPELLDEGRRILIFSQFTEMLAILETELKRRRLPFVKLTGSTKNREKPIREFQDKKVPLFLISLKAGGSGLNLTTADTVIHYDPWWNPAAEAQASDRAHRIGQKNPVFVHKLICEDTIEERILALQQTKAALVAGLLSGRTEKLPLNKADIERLLAPI